MLRGADTDSVCDVQFAEAKVFVESWRLEYNHHWPHSSLGHKMMAAFVAACIASASPTAQPQQYIE